MEFLIDIKLIFIEKQINMHVLYREVCSDAFPDKSVRGYTDVFPDIT